MIISKYINQIVSTGRNLNGRTPFVEHRIVNGKLKILYGEFLDSPDDLKTIQDLNQRTEEAKRDLIIKEHKSFENSKKIILTA